MHRFIVLVAACGSAPPPPVVAPVFVDDGPLWARADANDDAPWCPRQSVAILPVGFVSGSGTARTYHCFFGPTPLDDLQARVKRDPSIAACLDMLEQPSRADVELTVSQRGIDRIDVVEWNGDRRVLDCARRLARLELRHPPECRWRAPISLARW